VTAPPEHKGRRLARAVAAYRTVRARWRRLELWLEHRYPKLYDARHAATGIGRALWPLVGPLLAALVVVPIVALLAALVALLGIRAPSIDLPSVDLPDVPFPHLTAPGWLRAIGDAVGAFLSVVGPVARYVVLAAAVIIGVRRTRQVRRRRTAAEQIGRPELLRRAGGRPSAAPSPRPRAGASTLGEASVRDHAATGRLVSAPARGIRRSALQVAPGLE
jgi:hypothetical protein